MHARVDTYVALGFLLLETWACGADGTFPPGDDATAVATPKCTDEAQQCPYWSRDFGDADQLSSPSARVATAADGIWLAGGFKGKLADATSASYEGTYLARVAAETGATEEGPLILPDLAFRDLTSDAEGNAIVAGTVKCPDDTPCEVVPVACIDGPSTFHDGLPWIARFDGTGQCVWAWEHPRADCCETTCKFTPACFHAQAGISSVEVEVAQRSGLIVVAGSIPRANGDAFAWIIDPGNSTNPKQEIQEIGTGVLESSVAAAFDSSGNIVVTGHFEGTLPADGQECAEFPSMGGADVFVEQRTGDGACLWRTVFAGIGHERPIAISTDDNGDVLVTGYFGSPELRCYTAIGPCDEAMTVPNIGGNDGFVAKLVTGNNGSPEWTYPIGGPEAQQPTTLSVGPPTVVGFVLYGATDQSLDMASAGGAEIALVALDAQGRREWRRPLPGLGHQVLGDIVPVEGKLAITGSFEGSVTFDDATRAADGTRIFIGLVKNGE